MPVGGPWLTISATRKGPEDARWRLVVNTIQEQMRMVAVSWSTADVPTVLVRGEMLVCFVALWTMLANRMGRAHLGCENHASRRLVLTQVGSSC